MMTNEIFICSYNLLSPSWHIPPSMFITNPCPQLLNIRCLLKVKAADPELHSMPSINWHQSPHIYPLLLTWDIYDHQGNHCNGWHFWWERSGAVITEGYSILLVHIFSEVTCLVNFYHITKRIASAKYKQKAQILTIFTACYKNQVSGVRNIVSSYKDIFKKNLFILF